MCGSTAVLCLRSFAISVISVTRAVYFHTVVSKLRASAQFLLSYWPKDLDEYNLVEHK